MLTVDLARLPVGVGDRVLDMGCGAGRHAFALYRQGAGVVALDRSAADVREVRRRFGAMVDEVPAGASATAVQADAYALPFPDASFDVVVAAEVLEHLPADTTAMAELARVLRPGGLLAVTVPRWGPELVCWALSSTYHRVEGGHIRIYRRSQLRRRLRRTGLQHLGSHHAHGLHAPYWWLKCLVGVDDDAHVLVRAYHRLLVWDMMRAPRLTRWSERALNPVIGKSLVLYLRKPAAARAAA